MSAQQPVPTTQASADRDTNILLNEETPLHVRVQTPLSTDRSKVGDAVLFIVAQDVVVNGAVAIPRGATIHGKVTESRKGSGAAGKPDLVLKADSLDMAGHVYHLYAYEFRMQGIGAKPTVTSTPNSTAAQAPGGFGTNPRGDAASDSRAQTASANSSMGGSMSFGSAPALVVPADAQLDFYLAAPLAIQPVTAEQAAQMARRVPPGEPKTYLKGERN